MVLQLGKSVAPLFGRLDRNSCHSDYENPEKMVGSQEIWWTLKKRIKLIAIVLLITDHGR
jgi:hypothetical protein